MQRILFVGGGSVGHIAPSVAVWKALQERRPQASAHFVCADRSDDTEFLTKNGLSFTTLDTPKFGVSVLWKLLPAIRAARKIIEKTQPNLIFSKGGYVSVPVCYVAHQKKIPIILHESDAVGGRANALVAKWATHVCLGLPREHMKKNEHYTGNPIRAEVTKGSKEKGYSLTNFDTKKPVLLVMGGSQGAEALNTAVGKILPHLVEMCNVVHLTGRGKNLYAVPHPGYWAAEFLTEELADIYAITTIALSRAGAGSIAELSANTIPTIYVPLTGLAQNHQQKNAEVIAKAGGGIVVAQENIDAELLEKISTLIRDTHTQQKMCDVLGKFAKQDAALQIAEIISGTLDRGR